MITSLIIIDDHKYLGDATVYPLTMSTSSGSAWNSWTKIFKHSLLPCAAA